MSLDPNALSASEGGFLPPPVIPPPGGKAFVAFEMGMAQEVQNIQRIRVAGTVFKVNPLPAGPIAFDIDAPNGGTVKVFQADSLQALVTGAVRIETWTLTSGNRLIKGLTPIRRFVVLVVEGDGMRVEPRPLGSIERGPSMWRLGATITTWSGV